MSVITLVINFCFDMLTKCFTFLSSVEIFDGVSVFNFSLALVVITVVMFGLLTTVKISAGNSLSRLSRSKRK